MKLGDSKVNTPFLSVFVGRASFSNEISYFYCNYVILRGVQKMNTDC